MLKAVVIEDNKIRIIYGSLLNDLDIDWTIKSLEQLQKVIEFSLSDYFHTELPSLKKKRFSNLKVFSGSNHIDLIDDGVGTLNLLRVEDHFVESIKA